MVIIKYKFGSKETSVSCFREWKMATSIGLCQENFWLLLDLSLKAILKEVGILIKLFCIYLQETCLLFSSIHVQLLSPMVVNHYSLDTCVLRWLVVCRQLSNSMTVQVWYASVECNY